MRCQIVHLISNREISHGIHELVLPCTLPVKAGQFFMLKGMLGAAFLPRAISICDWDGINITLLVQKVGMGTAGLCALRQGDKIQLTGPLGNGFPLEENEGGNIALVGGGIGIAPMLFTAKRLRERGTPADCYLGYRSTPFYHREIEYHTERVFLSTDDGSAGHHGLVTEIFNPADYSAVFFCGPMRMMQAVVKLCELTKVPVYVSMETRMACGVGGCLVCACALKERGNLRACLDGPVFRGEDVCFDA